METWGWHVEWLFTWRAALILGLPIAWLATLGFLCRVARLRKAAHAAEIRQRLKTAYPDWQPSPTLPRVVCGWCGVLVRFGDPNTPVSHGICDACRTALEASDDALVGTFPTRKGAA
jgi:hypothetical protein